MAFETRQSIEGDLLITTRNVAGSESNPCWVDGSGNYIPNMLAVVINGVEYPVAAPEYFGFGSFNVNTPVPLKANDQVYLKSMCSADQSPVVTTLSINLRLITGNATTCANTTNVSAMYDDRVRLFFNGNTGTKTAVNYRLNNVNLERSGFFMQVGSLGNITSTAGNFTTNNNEDATLFSSDLYAPESTLKATIILTDSYQTMRLGYIEVIMAIGVLKYIDYINGGSEENLGVYAIGDVIEIFSSITSYVIKKNGVDIYTSAKNITFDLPPSAGSIVPNPTVAGTNAVWTLPITPGNYTIDVLIGEGVRAQAIATVTACQLTATDKSLELNKGTQNNSIPILSGTAPTNCVITSFKILSLPQCGTLKLGGVAVTVNQVIPAGDAGNLKVDVPIDCSQTSVNFQYSAVSNISGCQESNPATVTLPLAGASANAVDDSYRQKSGTVVNFNLTLNDTPCSFGNTFYEIVQNSIQNGSVSNFNTNTGFGVFTASSPSYTGNASFQYNIRCGMTLQDSVVVDSANVSIYFYGAIASDDTKDTMQNTAVSGNVSTNDIIACDGTTTFQIVTGSMKFGSLASFNQQTGEFTWIPQAAYVGDDGEFKYNVLCNGEVLASATVHINVNGVILEPDSENTFVNTPVTGNVSENDSYMCEGNITLAVKPGTEKNGMVTAFNTSTGAFTFMPATNFSGQASFMYEVFCGGVKVGEELVTITVTPACDVCAELKEIKLILKSILCFQSDLAEKTKLI